MCLKRVQNEYIRNLPHSTEFVHVRDFLMCVCVCGGGGGGGDPTPLTDITPQFLMLLDQGMASVRL